MNDIWGSWPNVCVQALPFYPHIFINLNVNIQEVIVCHKPPLYLQVHMCMFGMGFGSHYLRIVVLSKSDSRDFEEVAKVNSTAASVLSTSL